MTSFICNIEESVHIDRSTRVAGCHNPQPYDKINRRRKGQVHLQVVTLASMFVEEYHHRASCIADLGCVQRPIPMFSTMVALKLRSVLDWSFGAFQEEVGEVFRHRHSKVLTIATYSQRRSIRKPEELLVNGWGTHQVHVHRKYLQMLSCSTRDSRWTTPKSTSALEIGRHLHTRFGSKEFQTRHCLPGSKNRRCPEKCRFRGLKG